VYRFLKGALRRPSVMLLLRIMAIRPRRICRLVVLGVRRRHAALTSIIACGAPGVVLALDFLVQVQAGHLRWGDPANCSNSRLPSSGASCLYTVGTGLSTLDESETAWTGTRPPDTSLRRSLSSV